MNYYGKEDPGKLIKESGNIVHLHEINIRINIKIKITVNMNNTFASAKISFTR